MKYKVIVRPEAEDDLNLTFASSQKYIVITIRYALCIVAPNSTGVYIFGQVK